MGLGKLIRAFSFPWDQAKTRGAKGDSHTSEAATHKRSAVQHGVMGFPTLLFVLTSPFSCLTLFYCCRMSSTALATGSFRKMWFASFSGTEESHWLICHVLCLGNQSLKSLLNNIPKGYFSSQPQLFLFILVLFSWLLLLWFVIISNPLGWITRPKKGPRHPQRDGSPSLPGQYPRCDVADSRLSFSSPANPTLLAAQLAWPWGGWKQTQWVLSMSLSSPWPGGSSGKMGTLAFGFLRARRSRYRIAWPPEDCPAS